MKIAGTIALTAVIWAIIHVQYDLWDILWICFMGTLFGIARGRAGSIHTPMVLHMLLNLVATLETAYLGGDVWRRVLAQTVSFTVDLES